MAKGTHSEYVVLISLPLEKWLHERASILHFLAHCLSCLCVMRVNFRFPLHDGMLLLFLKIYLLFLRQKITVFSYV